MTAKIIQLRSKLKKDDIEILVRIVNGKSFCCISRELTAAEKSRVIKSIRKAQAQLLINSVS